jgi:Prenyltransferase and squalene oxidase repeat
VVSRRTEVGNLKSQILQDFLAKTQNPDGGWGYSPGKRSALEPTAYALMGLRHAAGVEQILGLATQFISSNQSIEGGWPVSVADPGSASWVTPLVGVALLSGAGEGAQTQAALQSVFGAFSRMPKSWMNRIGEWLGYRSSNVNTDLGGWSWNPGTAIWVEPTCYAILFLKKVTLDRQDQSVNHIISEAESMVYDRMCKNGGWNYGNAEVLGEELRPYPLTTTLALIALQDRSLRSENQKSLSYLKQAVSSEKSLLSLCFVGLCLDVYVQDWQSVWNQLDEFYRKISFLEDIKTTALMLITLDAREGNNPFRLKAERR